MSLAPHDCSAWVLNAKQRREVFWHFDTYLFEEVDKRVQQIGVHEALSHFNISLRLLVQSRHTKKFNDTFFMTHESTREMRSMPARPMWLWAVSATPHLVHDVPVTACFWRQVNHSSREKRCSYMIQFLWEMAVFLFVRNIFLCNLHHHPSTHPPIHPPSRRLGGAGAISGCHFMRAIIKGGCLVSMETAHFRGEDRRRHVL